MRLSHWFLLACSLVLLAGCGNDDDGDDDTAGTTATERAPRDTDATGTPRLRLVNVGVFEQPVLAIPVPGTEQVAVVEKVGRIRFVTGMTGDETVRDGRVVLDLTDEVSTGGEQGLLGLAFHPEWPKDPRIFINYTDVEGDTHVEQRTLASATGSATAPRQLLRIPQPYPNHNGGDLVFGPDGLLYIGTGDGGSGGDPEDRAQRPGELLGKMLRIDVDASGAAGYGIPDGNLDEGRPEVWATGLRNPWRFSFDAETGDLWIGDVGQNAFEEIDAVPASALEPDAGNLNFGWRRSEGFETFDESGATGPGTMTQPVLDYGRDDGCSVTGGQVYRGSAVPDLVGWYVFADFCGKDLRLVEAAGVAGSKQTRGSLDWVSQPGIEQIASFGLDPDGELLVVSLGGTIARIEAA